MCNLNNNTDNNLEPDDRYVNPVGSLIADR